MEPNKILKADVLDVIFDNRNKAYGAYELRMNYGKRAKRAMAIVIVLVCLSLSNQIVATFLSPEANQFPFPQQTLDTVIIRDLLIKDPLVEPIKNKVKDVDVTTVKVEQVATHIVPTEKVEHKVKKEPRDILPNAVDGVEDHQGTDEGFVKVDGTDAGTNTAVETNTNGTTLVVDPIIEPEEKVWETTEITDFPEFLGGDDEMIAFIKKNLVYPKKAIEDGIKGRVMLGFVVDKNGEIDEVKVVNAIGGGCDEEAMRVIKKMPKWKAGKSNGRNVKVYFNIPITFDLN